jgi:hypothetical protein
MSKCSWWKGGHKFVVVAKGVKNETWIQTWQGMKLAGSEYTRHRPTYIERCTKCQELRAFDGYNYTPVSIEFAKKKIIELGGIIEDGL